MARRISIKDPIFWSPRRDARVPLVDLTFWLPHKEAWILLEDPRFWSILKETRIYIHNLASIPSMSGANLPAPDQSSCYDVWRITLLPLPQYVFFALLGWGFHSYLVQKGILPSNISWGVLLGSPSRFLFWVGNNFSVWCPMNLWELNHLPGLRNITSDFRVGGVGILCRWITSR